MLDRAINEEAGGRSHRAGLLASRALRLSQTVYENQARPFLSAIVILACVLCILIIIGFGLGANFGYLGRHVAAPSAEAAQSLPPVPPNNEVALYDPPDLATPPGSFDRSRNGETSSGDIETAGVTMMIGNDGSVEMVIPEGSNFSAKMPAESERTPVPILTPCVAAVEDTLSKLRSKFTKTGLIPWSVRQIDVTALVQEVIDCPQITLTVTGSLELLPLGLSDLEVSWNRSEEYLGLRTVPVVADPKRSAFDDLNGALHESGTDIMTFVLR